MENTIKQKVHAKLGFKHLEAAEIVTRLDLLLCNYQVFFHKLQNYHWNVVGGEFFDLHDITEEMYTKGLTDIDEIAERIRVFGKTPTHRLSDYLEQAEIKDTTHDLSSEYMTLNLIEDIETLTSFIIDTSSVAHDNGDLGTVFMMNKLIQEFETYHWKLSSWTNSKFAK
jgi:starvation-inducible DNA-binding protein